jgi:hypothetical protein
MPRKLIPMAIAYDFDGTLAPGNIQENSFIPEIGMKKAAFWQQNKSRAEKHEADEVLSYMTFRFRERFNLFFARNTNCHTLT